MPPVRRPGDPGIPGGAPGAVGASAISPSLPPGSPLLDTPAPAGFRTALLEQEVCPFLALPGTPAALSSILPSRLRQNLRYYQRRWRRRGGRVRDGFGSIRRGVPRSVLHAAPGALETPRAPGRVRWKSGACVPREAAAGLLERGWLRLHVLRFNGEIAAAPTASSRAAGPFITRAGFRPELGRFSPGSLLLAHAVEAAAREGACEFDFLRGGEAYKDLWGARDRTNHRLLLWNSSSSGALTPGIIRCERAVERAAKWTARRMAKLER